MIQQTSIQAYQDLEQEQMRETYEKILWALRHGPMTDREIAAFLLLADPNKIRPRRNELVRLQYLEEAEKRKCRVSGKTAICWRIRT